MRKSALLPALLVLAAGTAWAQQELPPSTDQGPTPTNPAPPTPDEDGVYRLGDGIVAPVLVDAVPAEYPPDATDADRPHSCVLSVVVGADGVPTGIQPLNPHAGPFDDAAIAAVRQSKFQPGTLDGKPVPVLVHVRVPFFHLAPAVPRVMLHYAQLGGFSQRSQQQDPDRMQSNYTPPKLIQNVMPEFSTEARKKKIQGIVIVSALVTEDGEPVDLRLEKSLGYGLDEKALQAVSQYRFKPAMRDGSPVRERVTVEVNFKLF